MITDICCFNRVCVCVYEYTACYEHVSVCRAYEQAGMMLKVSAFAFDLKVKNEYIKMYLF